MTNLLDILRKKRIEGTSELNERKLCPRQFLAYLYKTLSHDLRLVRAEMEALTKNEAREVTLLAGHYDKSNLDKNKSGAVYPDYLFIDIPNHHGILIEVSGEFECHTVRANRVHTMQTHFTGELKIPTLFVAHGKPEDGFVILSTDVARLQASDRTVSLEQLSEHFILRVLEILEADSHVQ